MPGRGGLSSKGPDARWQLLAAGQVIRMRSGESRMNPDTDRLLGRGPRVGPIYDPPYEVLSAVTARKSDVCRRADDCGDIDV